MYASTAEQQHAWYERNREHVAEMQRAWRAANPERKRELDAAWRARNPGSAIERGRKWREDNPGRKREQSRRYHEENRLRINDKVREWAKANPRKRAEYQARRRARKIGSRIVPFTMAELEQRLSMFAGCWICGGAVDSVDHVKPLSAGGPHALCNLRPICNGCNASKGAKWPYP